MEVIIQLLPLELLFIVGVSVVLGVTFRAIIWFLTRPYKTQEIIDVEFTPALQQKPYEPGDNVDIET